MTINDEDLQRLQELPRKLMLLAGDLDALRWIRVDDETQQDLRWLSEQLPKLLEERWDLLQQNGQLKAQSGQVELAQEMARDLEQQLAQAQTEVERLRLFAELVTKLNDREGLEPASLWHVMEMAKQALNSGEAK